MTDTTRLEGVIFEVYNHAIHANIETQVILQLLVKKGIVTPEEVATTRTIVSKQPKYKQILDIVNAAIAENNEAEKFEELFAKSLQPGPNGKPNITDEEREYLLRKLKKL